MGRVSVSIGIVASMVVLLMATTVRPRAQTPEQTPPRKIPGINAPDAFPLACVDCHRNKDGVDFRISALMKQWVVKVSPKLMTAAQAAAPPGMKLAGKHPKVDFALANIPGGCTPCHGRNSESAPPFSRLMHSVHVATGANRYVTEYQGECTHCHKLNVSRGQWTTPSGPEKP